MKTSSKGLFILAITYIALALLWFFWVRNTALGILWLCLGLVELVLAFIRKKKERE